MEMGKLTAKLRDAVPVCLLVKGKEIKRYKNIDIPDDFKKLEYQDFEFNVPADGNITFRISFAHGILPEEFPQARERKTRAPKEVLVAVANETHTATLVEKGARQRRRLRLLYPSRSRRWRRYLKRRPQAERRPRWRKG